MSAADGGMESVKAPIWLILPAYSLSCRVLRGVSWHCQLFEVRDEACSDQDVVQMEHLS